jgi:hypothetical protein
MALTAHAARSAIKALGYSLIADSYSRAKGRPHIRVTSHDNAVRVTVALAEVRLPSHLDDRAEDRQIASHIMSRLVCLGYIVKADKKSPWIFTVDRGSK